MTPSPRITISEFLRAFAIVFVAGASLAGAVNLLSLSELGTFALDNAMTPRNRSRLILSLGLGGAAACALVWGVAFLRRRDTWLSSAERWSRVLLPLCLALLVPFLFEQSLAGGRALWFLALAAAAALVLERTLRTSAAALGSLPWWRPLPDRLPVLILAVAIATTALHFAVFTIRQHHRLQTSSFDLAIFDNMMWNLMHGRGWKASPELGRVGSHLGVHANFIALLLVPAYALRPSAEALLVIQAVVVSAGAVPFFLFARRRLGPYPALAVAAAYLAYAPLHAAVFYDFHFLTLAPFFFGWVLYFFDRGSRFGLIVAWTLALLVREDQGAMLAILGLFFVLEGQRVRAAAIGAFASAAYFVVVKLGIMPLFLPDKTESFTWMYSGFIAPGEHGFKAVVRTLVSNPVFALKTVLEPHRMAFVLQTQGPLLFLSLRHRTAWLLLLAPALFTVGSTHTPLFEPYYQYTANWLSAGLVGVVFALDRLGPGVRRNAAVLALLFASAIFSVHYGSFARSPAFRAGFRTVEFGWSAEHATRLAQLRQLARKIPRHASVAATETEAPHVAVREDCFTLRYGHGDADYLLVAAHAMDPGTLGHFNAAMATGQYGLVELEGPFTLWQRGADRARNAEGLARLGLPPSP